MSDPIKVEKGIPVPPRTGRGSLAQTLSAMEPGDSFFTSFKSHRAYVYLVAGKIGVRITVAACTENGVDGFRVWRLADKT